MKGGDIVICFPESGLLDALRRYLETEHNIFRKGNNMRSKLFVALCMGIIMAWTVTGANAFTDYKFLNEVLTGYDTTSWNHATPTDFEVPYDVVNSATLTINAFSADGANTVYAEGNIIGQLNGGFWSWSSTPFDIKEIFASWDNGNLLNVSVKASDMYLYLKDSIFNLDYVNGFPDGGDNNAPVPEPATLFLLGSGLSGLAYLGRRRNKLAE